MSLYDRLPSGPHGLDKAAVASNQRARLYGAMAHAVSAHGYPSTSVAEVIRLAGVSRTTFYEHFANKQDCLLAAYETMAYRMIKNVKCGWRSSGDWRGALDGAFDALASEVVFETSATRMVIFEGALASPEALERADRVRAVFEQMLHQSLSQSPAGPDVSKTLLRGIIGGIRNVLYRRLYPENAAELAGVIDELAAWTLSYHTPAAAMRGETDSSRRLNGERLELSHREPATRQSEQRSSSPAPRASRTKAPLPDARVQKIVQTFEQITKRAARSTACAYLAAPDWPAAIHESLAALSGFIAAHPTFGQLGFTEVSKASPGVGAQAHELLADFAELLARGYELCDIPRSPIVSEAIAGAIWENIHYQASNGSIHLLAGMGDELTHIALAPFIGSWQAARALSPEPRLDAVA